MRFARLTACLLALASAACATTGAVPRPFPVPGTDGTDTAARPPQNPPLKLDGDTIAGTALGLRGVRYRPGGEDPSGFDCSGLVVYVFAQHGIVMPRLVREQYEVGRRVKPAALKPGDLLFFSTKGGGASHVAIAIGGNQFVHAPTSTGVVRVEALNSDYWGPRYLGARRIPANN
jgi:cell wall-associated NlpC family hydrolase